MLERIHAKAQAESADQKRSFSVQQTSLNANRSRTLHSIHSTTFLTQASPLHTWTILFNPITLSHLPCSPRDFRRQKRVVPSYGISSYELALIHRAHAKGLTVRIILTAKKRPKRPRSLPSLTPPPLSHLRAFCLSSILGHRAILFAIGNVVYRSEQSFD